MPWKTCMWRGKAQVEISAISAVVLAAVLASRRQVTQLQELLKTNMGWVLMLGKPHTITLTQQACLAYIRY